MSLEAISAVQQMLKDHALSASLTGETLSVGNARISASVFTRPGKDATRALQLDINLHSPLLGSRTLVESFAGWGPTEEEALHQALAKFSRSSLHVLLEVFVGNGHGGEQIEWETWEYLQTKWRICLGPQLVLGFSEKRPENLACGALLDRLRDGLLPTLKPQCHWLRFYYMTQGGARIASECLLDNANWPSGQLMVDQNPWPSGDYSVRNFLVLLPD